MAKRNYTRELKAAQAGGDVIVSSLGPYPGQKVSYRPRSASDPQPWAIKDQHGLDYDWRYSGRECHAVPACRAKIADGKTCVKPEGHDKAHSPR